MEQLRFFCSKKNLEDLIKTHGVRDPKYIGTIFENLDVVGYGENEGLCSFVVSGNMASARALVQRLEGGFF